METEISKDIRQYNETIYFGLTMRQLLCVIAGIGISALAVWLLHGKVSTNIICWIVCAVMVPFCAVGFVKVNGQNFETFIAFWWRFNFVDSQEVKILSNDLMLNLIKDEIDALDDPKKKKQLNKKIKKEAKIQKKADKSKNGKTKNKNTKSSTTEHEDVVVEEPHRKKQPKKREPVPIPIQEVPSEIKNDTYLSQTKQISQPMGEQWTKQVNQLEMDQKEKQVVVGTPESTFVSKQPVKKETSISNTKSEKDRIQVRQNNQMKESIDRLTQIPYKSVTQTTANPTQVNYTRQAIIADIDTKANNSETNKSTILSNRNTVEHQNKTQTKAQAKIQSTNKRTEQKINQSINDENTINRKVNTANQTKPNQKTVPIQNKIPIQSVQMPIPIQNKVSKPIQDKTSQTVQSPKTKTVKQEPKQEFRKLSEEIDKNIDNNIDYDDFIDWDDLLDNILDTSNESVDVSLRKIEKNQK